MVAVVSQPDRPRGRGRKPSASPVSEIAREAKLPLLTPEHVGAPALLEELRGFAPDLGVVVAYGQFLPRALRELPRLGYLINAHASLLPRYRGAAPIARAILAGETQTGISLMRVEREMDAGAVAGIRSLEIRADEDCEELSARLAALAAEAVHEVLEQIADGSVRFTPQDHARATLAPKLSREEARLDWREASDALVRQVRAMAPRPGAYTSHGAEGLRILSARSIPGEVTDPPGTVRRGKDPALRIATGDGWLAPLRLQRPGGRPLDTAAFLRGQPIPDGVRLGDEGGTDTLEPR